MIEHASSDADTSARGLSKSRLAAAVNRNAEASWKNPNSDEAVPLLSEPEKGFNARFVVIGNNAPSANISQNSIAAVAHGFFANSETPTSAAESAAMPANEIFK